LIGFNHNEKRIQQYKCGIDSTHEVGNDVIQVMTVDFTSDEKRLSEAKFLIVAVLIPINEDKTPNL
jgi:UDP-N-acetyl-D-mannosaminuronate dehydrogenase